MTTDRSRLLPHLLLDRARTTPDATFIEMVDGPTVTYGAFAEEMTRYAHGFAGAGIKAEDRVALLLPNGVDAVNSWLAIAWLKAYEVPVNTAYQGNTLAHVLGHSGATMLITTPDFLPRVEQVADRLDDLSTIVLVGNVDAAPAQFGHIRILSQSTLLAAGERGDIGTGPDPWDICSVMYTSGTTGPSKGVLVPWAQYLASTVSQPIENTFGVGDGWYSPLRFVGIVPVPADIDEFRARFGVEVCTAYNSTEICSPISSDGFNMTNANQRSAGRVRDGFECRVVDEHDREVPDGQLGELVVRADEPWTLMAGYLDMAEATAHAWRNGWFHTGDGFVRDTDGSFRFVDRKKDAIRRRGENISSIEIEAEANDHPDVLESAAVAYPSPLGEDDVKIWVVRRPGARLPAGELVSFLGSRLPAFMVPRYVEFAENLPKTDTMKIRKSELVRRANGTATWDRETQA